MQKKTKVKISKKVLQEKYPTKVGQDEKVVQFASRLFLTLGLFVLIALSVDVFHFTH